MNKTEIKSRIEELRESLNNFEEPDKTFKKSELNQFEIQLEGMALSEIADKMESIELADLESMDQQIQAAKDANRRHTSRVEAFNNAFIYLKGALL